MKRKYKVILDTNVLLVSISSKSSFNWLFQALIQGKFEIFITTEILLEYEEVINRKWNREISKATIRTLIELPNVHLSTSHFKLNLISDDPDDNKFVDCAFANSADYIITNDKHFDILDEIEFPKIPTLTIQEFKVIFED